ncbi:casparian strip membrane protein 1-like [Lotus japonicus]|uniref:CASP-like protein n=1 Tax=Lotus japonicus TaxID=34305 RepID=I3SC10_LOTJA|nr:casparian strip membrane protein 1-like [Lotus japonicus]AFK37802.1 unknown [Lotus japonicus]
MKGGSIEIGEVSKGASQRKGMKRGLSIMDFILRIVAAAATLGGAVGMGTAEESLPFVTNFMQFRAEYDDLPSFVFFVLANSLVCGYLVLSLILSVFHIVRSSAVKSRVLLIVFDTVMLGLLIAGASAAAAIVYLAHNGNSKANWFPICQQFNNYCQQASGSVVGSYIAVAFLIILILLSAAAISRH